MGFWGLGFDEIGFDGKGNGNRGTKDFVAGFCGARFEFGSGATADSVCNRIVRHSDSENGATAQLAKGTSGNQANGFLVTVSGEVDSHGILDWCLELGTEEKEVKRVT